MFLGFEYIKYRWNAKRRHGVHSPFIYELTDQCLNKRPELAFSEFMAELQKRYKNNRLTVEITDHGVGSKRMGNVRQLGKIYNTSSSRGRYGKMLHQLMAHYNFESALELGTSLGVGTVCLTTGNPQASIITIEGCPNTHAKAQEMFSALGMDQIKTIQSTFNDAIPTLGDQKFDLIFIDGHHDGPALLSYLEQLQIHSHDNTFFILDDIRWSSTMLNAWNQIVASPDYHVTIDLFRMGIALKRPQQEKEHFTIRL